MKHTPGPWTIESSKGYIDSSKTEMATLFHSIHDPDGKYLASTWARPNLVDARLMAAAPEMLEVLQLLYASLTAERTEDASSITLEIDQKMRAAIAKATGETE